MTAYPKPDFLFYAKFYVEQLIKAFLFFTIVGFITSPLWNFLFTEFNFCNLPLMGLAIVFGIFFGLIGVGIVYSILAKIICLFIPGK